MLFQGSRYATQPEDLYEGDIVTVIGEELRLFRHQGIIIDIESDLSPEDGPIAVFFDIEVENHELGIADFRDPTWKGGPPDRKSYKKCNRVKCFKPCELIAVPDFNTSTLIKRYFGRDGLTSSSWNFRLKPNTHACQLDTCATDLKATKVTFINFWGNIQMVYTCGPCHAEWNKRRTETFKLKSPLPGCVR